MRKLLSTTETSSCTVANASCVLLKNKISEKDKTVTSFNIGINDGKEAGQTISHCHIHLIPRRKGDVKEPSGGIRHIIPEKGFY